MEQLSMQLKATQHLATLFNLSITARFNRMESLTGPTSIRKFNIVDLRHYQFLLERCRSAGHRDDSHPSHSSNWSYMFAATHGTSETIGTYGTGYRAANCVSWRRGRDLNSRSTKWTPVFKTGGLNRSPTPPGFGFGRASDAGDRGIR
jgi:hypothetical protein